MVTTKQLFNLTISFYKTSIMKKISYIIIVGIFFACNNDAKNNRDQLLDEMCMALGGRAAEEIIFGKISTGALSDLERITKMAYSIVSVYGMNKNIGNLSFFDSKQSDYNFTKPYSESTAEKIDSEVKRIIDNAYNRTKKLLTEKREQLEKIANKLLEKEILFQNDLENLIGKRPFKDNRVNIQESNNRSKENSQSKPSDNEEKINKNSEE